MYVNDEWYRKKEINPDNPEELEAYKRYIKTYEGRRENNPLYDIQQKERNARHRKKHYKEDCICKRDSARRRNLDQKFGMKRDNPGWLVMFNIVTAMPRDKRSMLQKFHKDNPEQYFEGFTFVDGALAAKYTDAIIPLG